MLKSITKNSINQFKLQTYKFNQSRKMHVQYIKMRWGTGDNYSYLLTDDKTTDSWIIDPAEPHEYVFPHSIILIPY